MTCTKIKINFSFLIMVLLNLITNNFLDLLAVLCAFLVHEFGHFIMIKIKRGKINKIEIDAFGGRIYTDKQNSLLVDFGRSYF